MAQQRRSSGPPLKDRIYTTLYRLRYGWQFQSSIAISHENPIWVLGEFYHGKAEDVYVHDVLDLFEDDNERGLVLLVPVRLGSEALNPIYAPCVTSLLSLDHCVGIIGGKPKHSVYFVGFQDDKLLYLDPHYCQSAIEVPPGQTLDDSLVKTYHCSVPRKLAATKMDPSCTVGFYCRNRDEFLKLRESAEKVLAPPRQKGVYPFFTFIDQRADDAFTDTFEQQLNSLSGHGATMSICEPSTSLKRRKSSGKDIDNDFIIHDDDDFVIVEVRPGAGSLSSPRHSLPQGERTASPRHEEREIEDSAGEGKPPSVTNFQWERMKMLVEQEGEGLVENWVESQDETDKKGEELKENWVESQTEMDKKGEKLVENWVESQPEIDKKGEELTENGHGVKSQAELSPDLDDRGRSLTEDSDIMADFIWT